MWSLIVGGPSPTPPAAVDLAFDAAEAASRAVFFFEWGHFDLDEAF